jgi:outer membrane lipoprotein SlyB
MKPIIAAFVGLSLIAGAAPAAAQHRGDNYRWDGDRNSKWDPADHYRSGKYRERRLSKNDRVYRGRDGRYYCRRNDGSTGLVIGAIAGGLLGNAIGGDTLSTLIGGGGGALLGRSLDRGKVRCR